MKTIEPELIPAEPTQAIAVRPEQALAMRDPESILRYAVDAKASVEVIERMMAVRRELRAEQAKEAFDKAMADFQAECPIIVKGKGVHDNSGKVAFKYAPIEDVEAQIRPYTRKHGFNHTYDTDVSSEPGWVIAKCIVTHTMGHCLTTTVKFPLVRKTSLMSDTQVYFGTLTSSCRRALQNAYGLIIAGEDMDGRGAAPKPQGPSTVDAEPGVRELARELWNVLAPVRGTAKNWGQANSWLVDECVLTPEEHGGDHAPELSPARFREAISKAKGKVAK